MGYMQSEGLREAMEEGYLELEQAISVHLRSNHYPPVHEAFIPVCIEAINRANSGDWDSVLEYPNGLTRTVSYTIEGLHLRSFLDIDEEDWF